MCERILVGRRRQRHRRGSILVEFLVCLPVIAMLVFGAVQASRHVFLKQTLLVACYEGVREAARPDATEASALERARRILDSRGVHGCEIRFPDGVQSVVRGLPVQCQITATTEISGLPASRLLPGRSITTRLVTLKE